MDVHSAVFEHSIAVAAGALALSGNVQASLVNITLAHNTGGGASSTGATFQLTDSR